MSRVQSSLLGVSFSQQCLEHKPRRPASLIRHYSYQESQQHKARVISNLLAVNSTDRWHAWSIELDVIVWFHLRFFSQFSFSGTKNTFIKNAHTGNRIIITKIIIIIKCYNKNYRTTSRERERGVGSPEETKKKTSCFRHCWLALDEVEERRRDYGWWSLSPRKTQYKTKKRLVNDLIHLITYIHIWSSRINRKYLQRFLMVEQKLLLGMVAVRMERIIRSNVH